MEVLQEGAKWSDTAARIAAMGVDVEQLQDQPPADADCHWIFATFGLRDTGDLEADIERTLKYRAKLKRVLEEKFHAQAIWIKLDIGEENGHPHLHALIYAPFINRERLVVWQKKQTCTVKGCKHPADDRCDECRANKCECHHPHDDGSLRCNGAWDVDLRQADDPGEVLKYVCSPSLPATELRLAVYIATYRRKRTMTYGLARPNAIPAMEATVKKERAESAANANICPECGQVLVYESCGWKHGDRYRWRPYRRGEPYEPPSCGGGP
jgi:hypothetical protein